MTASARTIDSGTTTPAAASAPFRTEVEGADLELERRLEVTVDWLKRAQDSQPEGGVSALYTLARGWHRSFPETTGYIIPTMLNAWRTTDDPTCFDRSVRMAQWLLTVQQEDGSFPSDRLGMFAGPSVFNTGQVLFGLVRMHQITAESRYLEAARRAGRWLASVQDADGAWRKWDYLGATHVYNTRTAWALLLLAEETQDEVCRQAGVANVRWAVSQADDDGFFARCAFDPQPGGRRYGLRKSLAVLWKRHNLPSFYTKASLHAIAYTIQGLLEAAWILDDEAAEACALRAAHVLARHVLEDRLAGYYHPGWKRAASSSCLTGIAQMCIVWLRAHQVRGSDAGGDELRNAAGRAVGFLERSQKLRSHNPALRGALAGSKPLWGLYQPFRYPNWAVKFWADALLLRLALKQHPEWLPQIAIW